MVTWDCLTEQIMLFIFPLKSICSKARLNFYKSAILHLGNLLTDFPSAYSCESKLWIVFMFACEVTQADSERKLLFSSLSLVKLTIQSLYS